MICLDDQPCPVCRCEQSQLVHRTTYPEHAYPGQFVLRRCSGCGLMFNSPRLNADELSKLYGKNYYFFLRSDRSEFRRIVAMYQRTVALVEQAVPDRSLLDIGCGRGYFPAVLKRLGWDAAGVEISPQAACYAREKFGLEVFTGTIEQYAACPQARQFALVTAIDVIEHVPQPEAFVTAAAKIVKPGGWFIIDTPNAQAHNIRLKSAAWKGFNPFHIYLFSIENLTELLGRHGFSVHRSFSYGNTPTPLSLKDRAVGRLKKLGLLGPVARIYFGLRKLRKTGGDPVRHLKLAESLIRAAAPYSQSPDSSGPLAASRSGDNIVVIARRD